MVEFIEFINSFCSPCVCVILMNTDGFYLSSFFFYFRMVEDVKADIALGRGRPKPAFGPYVCVCVEPEP